MCQIINNYDIIIDVPLEGVCDSSEQKDVSSLQSFFADEPKLHSLLIAEQCIQNRVSSLAKQIVKDLNHTKHIDILLVLTGSFIFASDLSRFIFKHGGINASIHCIKTSVYDKTIKTSGEHYRAVTLELSPKHIEGRDVLLVEDIADQGFTLSWLTHYLLHERKAQSLKVCSLLYKRLDNPSKEVQNIRNQLSIDYIGFTVPDVWVAGYGIDVAYEYRHLPYIVRVNEEYFK